MLVAIGLRPSIWRPLALLLPVAACSARPARAASCGRGCERRALCRATAGRSRFGFAFDCWSRSTRRRPVAVRAAAPSGAGAGHGPVVRGRAVPAGSVADGRRRGGSRGPERPAGRPGCSWSATSGSWRRIPHRADRLRTWLFATRASGLWRAGAAGGRADPGPARRPWTPSLRSIRPLGPGPPALDLRLPRRSDHGLGGPAAAALGPGVRAGTRWSPPRRERRLRRLSGLAGPGDPRGGARRRAGTLPSGGSGTCRRPRCSSATCLAVLAP